MGLISRSTKQGGGTVITANKKAAAADVETDMATLYTWANGNVDANNDPTAVRYGTAGEFTTRQGAGEETPSATTSVTLDFTAKNLHEITMTDNITSITITNTNSVPATHILKVTNHASSPKTMTGWPAVVKWPANVEPVLTNGNSAVDIFYFFADSGGDIHGVMIGNSS